MVTELECREKQHTQTLTSKWNLIRKSLAARQSEKYYETKNRDGLTKLGFCEWI